MSAEAQRAQGALLIAAAILATFSSSFGQTFFISFFGAEIRASHGLGHGDFGLVYLVATTASAALLMRFGELADTVAPRLLLAAVILGLAGACLLMAGSNSLATLLLAVLGLRFFGQGMLSHAALTTVARLLSGYRGRALALAVLGFSVGEMVLLLAAGSLVGSLGWRATWMVTAGALAFVSLPVVVFLLSAPRLPWGTARATPAEAAAHPGEREAAPEAHALRGPPPDHQATPYWTRRAVVRDPVFLMLLLLAMAPSFIVTGLFFHQAHLASTKGWSMLELAAFYPGYAAVSVLASLLAGVLIDRLGSLALLRGYLMPLGGALVLLAIGDGLLSAGLAFALLGITAGIAAPLHTALWAELYGTRHLGAIKATVAAILVLASALSPGLLGVLLDHGVPLESQLLFMAVYTAAASLLVPLAANRRMSRGGLALVRPQSP